MTLTEAQAQKTIVAIKFLISDNVQRAEFAQRRIALATSDGRTPDSVDCRLVKYYADENARLLEAEELLESQYEEVEESA